MAMTYAEIDDIIKFEIVGGSQHGTWSQPEKDEVINALVTLSQSARGQELLNNFGTDELIFNRVTVGRRMWATFPMLLNVLHRRNEVGHWE